jgi:hypothetical protein
MNVHVPLVFKHRLASPGGTFEVVAGEPGEVGEFAGLEAAESEDHSIHVVCIVLGGASDLL